MSTRAIASGRSELLKNVCSTLGIHAPFSVRIRLEAGKNARVSANGAEFLEDTEAAHLSSFVQGVLKALELDGKEVYSISIIYAVNEAATVRIERFLSKEEDANLSKRFEETKFVLGHL